MKAIIVTGSRHLKDRERVWNVLSALDHGVRIDVLIHGDADGADYQAGRWAQWSCANVAEIPMPAQWDKHGPFGAGPRRNAEMLQVLIALKVCGYDIEVHAFPLPDSKGTWNMVRQARAQNVPVVVHDGGSQLNDRAEARE